MFRREGRSLAWVPLGKGEALVFSGQGGEVPNNAIAILVNSENKCIT